ncbi:unnamed protein product [Ectocarpus sp. CCAP 1310/34]|nr:unnamed protein product [Ectocarpus sp. CCAP 1310/34]
MVKHFDVQSTSRIPASPGVDLTPKRDDEKGGKWPVREAIGSMMWVSTFSRPDVSFAVRAVTRHVHARRRGLAVYWDVIRKILGYLKEKRDLGITYQRGSWLGLAVYVHASYADTEDKRSVSGLATTVGGTVVSHGSKTQSIVYLSSTEAEYIVAGEDVKEALFVRAVLSFVTPETSGSSIQVLEDNQGAIALVQNPLSSGRTKHIDVRFHFIRGLFSSGDISVKSVPTTEQHADLLIKAFSRANLQYHRRKLMNLPEWKRNQKERGDFADTEKADPEGVGLRMKDATGWRVRRCLERVMRPTRGGQGKEASSLSAAQDRLTKVHAGNRQRREQHDKDKARRQRARVADGLRVERSRGPAAAIPPEPVSSPPAAPSYATAAASPATRSSGHSLVFKNGDDLFAKGRLSDTVQAAQFNFRSADRERVLLTATRVAVDVPVGATVSDAVHAAKHNAELHGKVELLVSALRAAHGRVTQQVQWLGCTIPSAAALAPVPSATTFDLPPPPKQHKAGAKSGGRGPGKGSGGSSSGGENDSNGWCRSNDSGAGRCHQGGRPRDASSDRRQAGGHQRDAVLTSASVAVLLLLPPLLHLRPPGRRRRFGGAPAPPIRSAEPALAPLRKTVLLGRLPLANGMTQVFPLPGKWYRR